MQSIQQLKQHIFECCQRPANLFGPSFFSLHIEQVEKFSLQLAVQLGADKEVVQIAALIHDIAAVTDFSTLVQHAGKGAEMAVELLKDYPMSPERKGKVLFCIRTHSKPIATGADIPEAVCISNADAMSQITQSLYWTFYIFGVRRFSFEDGRKWYEQRVSDNWNDLIQPAREILNPTIKKPVSCFNSEIQPLD